MKIGYKGTYNYFCKNQKYEIGKTYELPNNPILCSYGFHYCLNAKNIFSFYLNSRPGFKLLEIEDISNQTKSDSVKSVTNKIRVIREISDKQELLNLFGNYHFHDERNNLVYYESRNGYWKKLKYDELNRLTHNIDSRGLWEIRKYNEKSRLIYFEDSSGYYKYYEYDEHDRKIYYSRSIEAGAYEYKYDENGKLETCYLNSVPHSKQYVNYENEKLILENLKLESICK